MPKTGQFHANPDFIRYSNFVNSQPILMKFTSNCTNLRSASPFPKSKSWVSNSKLKIRINSLEKSGFLARGNFPDLPLTGFRIWAPNRIKNRWDLEWLNSTLNIRAQAQCAVESTLLPWLTQHLWLKCSKGQPLFEINDKNSNGGQKLFHWALW